MIMNNVLIAGLIGIGAGVVDALPMIIMKEKWVATLSAFLHYFVLGLVIPFVNWGLESWLQGLIISVLSAIPVAIMVYPTDKKAFMPILGFSIFLGVAIGYVGGIFIVP